MIIYVFSALAGVLTVLAPCVLPMLPVIVGGSLTGKDKARPYIVSISLVVSLVAFTLLLKASTVFIHIDPRVWTVLSGIIVILLGIAMLFPGVWEAVAEKIGLNRSRDLLNRANRKHTGTKSAILTGLALGPVFSSCSPTYAWIIATVLPTSWARGVAALTVYCIFLVLTLLGIALLGRKLLARYSWAADPRGWFQRTIAVLFIIVGLAIATGVDSRFQVWAANHIPGASHLEQQLLPAAENDEEDTPAGNGGTVTTGSEATELKDAPELEGLEHWINSDPLTLEQLRGKVVLIDFWTYSCINCIRTQPYLNAWYDRYKDDGFVIIGVHAPEFAFERDPQNVERGVKDANITYPVALDNDFTTWNNYHNRYWPAKYLIDRDGKLRYHHFGEGEYDETENKIRELLDSDEPRAELSEDPESNQPFQSPETYVGTARAEGFAGRPQLANGTRDYTTPATPEENQWSLGGTWAVDDESATAEEDDATLTYTFTGQQMFLVLGGPAGSHVRVEVAGDAWGSDAPGGIVTLNETRLYRLVKLDGVKEATPVTLHFDKGVKAHAFTFG